MEADQSTDKKEKCSHPDEYVVDNGGHSHDGRKKQRYCKRCGSYLSVNIQEEDENREKVLAIQLWLEGASYREIEEILGRSDSTIRSWIGKYCDPSMEGIRLEKREIRTTWKVANPGTIVNECLRTPDEEGGARGEDLGAERKERAVKELSGVIKGGRTTAGNQEDFHVLLVTSWLFRPRE